MPGGLTLRSKMIDAAFVTQQVLIQTNAIACSRQSCDYVGCRVGDGPAPGRRAVLVVDDAQFVLFLSQPPDGEQEVLPAQAIDPAGTENQVRDAAGLHRLFAGELAAAIHVERTRCICFRIGAGLGAV